MKIPDRPRALQDIFKDKIIKNPVFTADRTVTDVVKQYNEDYLHWEEVRRKDMPQDPEVIWALMKMSRQGQSRHVTLMNTSLTYNTTSRSQRIMHMLDTTASGLLVLEEPLNDSEMKRYVISSLMEEAIASSQLEGAVTTTKVAKQMLRTNRKPRTPSEQMIVNDFLTMMRVKEIKDLPCTIDLILQLHRLITYKTLDDPLDGGRFRTDDETVVADPLELEKVYHRPPSHEKIPGYMKELCQFINGESGTEFQHPLIKAIILHFMIGYVHPFVDGNGRLARALMYWYALKSNYWLFEHMAISKVIKEHRGKYGMAYLYAETDENDITYFINFNLQCMEEALDNTRQYIRRKQQERRAAMKMVESHPELNFRQAEILRDMIKNRGGSVSVREIASKFNVVHQTARTDLLSLAERGFIDCRKVGNKLFFVYTGTSSLNDRPRNALINYRKE